MTSLVISRQVQGFKLATMPGAWADEHGKENKDASEDGMSGSGVMDNERDSGDNDSKAEALQPEITTAKEAPSTVAQADEASGLIKFAERLGELTTCNTVWSMQGSVSVRGYFAEGRGQDEESNDGKDGEIKGISCFVVPVETPGLKAESYEWYVVGRIALHIVC